MMPPQDVGDGGLLSAPRRNSQLTISAKMINRPHSALRPMPISTVDTSSRFSGSILYPSRPARLVRRFMALSFFTAISSVFGWPMIATESEPFIRLYD